MKGDQWSLVIFTVLIQLTVGLFIFSGTAYFLFLDPIDDVLIDLYFRIAVLTVIAGLLSGMLVSLFHLGSPKNAPRVLLNLGSSWLSAEIGFVLLFGLMVAGFTSLLWLGLGITLAGKMIFWFSCCVGLCLIYCMTKVYRLTTVPVWNTPVTLFSFFKTTFLLGVIAAGGLLWVFLAISVENVELAAIIQIFNTYFRWIVLSALLLIELDTIVIIFRLISIKRHPENMGKGFSRVVAQNRTSLYLHFFLGPLGLVLFSLPLIWDSCIPDNGWVNILLIGLSFSLILISELIDRKLFYASFDRAGL